MAYIAPKTEPAPGCIFCTKPAADRDVENHILHRGERCYMMLNLYPYSNGHLMVVPYQHLNSIEKLEAATLVDMLAQVQLAQRVIRATMHPDGFNMGINEGKAAGAGYEEHVHLHVVPRWNGDTNFMPVLADVKVMPEHIDTVYQQLKQALAAIL
ncbi:MAG: HIT domain-containing protein [Ktedonobacteraceae bacterium]